MRVGRIALLALTSVGLAARADTTVFQDNFNRPDSATLGGAWVEQNELTGTACCHSGIRIDPGNIELAGNAMVFHYTKLPDSQTPSANALPYTYAPLGTSIGAAALSFTFIAGSDRMDHFVGLMDSSGGFVDRTGEPYGRFNPRTGIAVELSKSGVGIGNSAIGIMKVENGQEAYVGGPLPLPFQLVAGQHYSVTFTTINDRAAVTISDGTTTVGIGPVVLNGFAFPIDQVFVEDYDGGISSVAPVGDNLVGFDDIVVVAKQRFAQRSFVSAAGNDLFTCAVVAPCRSFSAAIAHTFIGGEVVVLDSGGYGPATITQGISIVAPPGVYAGISVPTGQAGLTINTNGQAVSLRGLTINSQGGQSGVAFVGAGTLYLDRMLIEGFQDASAVDIDFSPSAAAKLSIVDSDLQSGNVGLRASTLAGAVDIVVENVRFTGNGVGMSLDSSGGDVAVRNSTFVVGTLAPQRGIELTCESGSPLSATRDRVTIVSNGAGPAGEGLYTLGKRCAVGTTATHVTVRNFSTAVLTAGAQPADPPPHATSTVWLSGSAITGNTNAFSDPTSTFGTTLSRGDNTIEGNTSGAGAGLYTAK